MKILYSVFLVTLVSLSYGQSEKWTLTGEIPQGDRITAMTHNPNNGDIYVSTIANRLYKSTDKGEQWNEISTDVPSGLGYEIETIQSLGFNYVNEILLVGTSGFNGAGGVFWTPNDGLGWSHECFYFSNGQTGGCTSVNQIEVFDHGNNSTIIMAQGHLSPSNGNSWQLSIGNDVGIYDYEQGVSNDYAVVIYQGNNELIRANGGFWDLVAQLPPSMSGAQGYKLGITSQGDMFMGLEKGFSSPSNGVFKSTTGGTSWTDVSAGLADSTILDLKVNPANNKIYVATETEGVWVSDDGGSSWSAMNTGMMDSKVTGLMVTEDGDLYASGFLGGLYFFNEQANSWETRNQGISMADGISELVHDPDGNMWIMNTNTGLMYQNTNGKHDDWIMRSSGIDYADFWQVPRALYQAKNGDLFARAGRAFFAYDATSSEWELKSANLPNINVQQLHGIAAESGTGALFAVTGSNFDFTLHFSDDEGASWSTVITSLPNETFVDLEVISGSDVYLYTKEFDFSGNTIWKLKRLTFQMGSWSAQDLDPLLANGNPNQFPRPDLHLNQSNQLHLVIEGTRLYKYQLGTDSWDTLANGGWPLIWNGISAIYDFTFDNQGAMHYSHNGAGVFVSLDNGQQWTSRNDGFDETQFAMKALTFSNTNTPFGITSEGLYYYGEDTVTIDTGTAVVELTKAANNMHAWFREGQLVLEVSIIEPIEQGSITIYDLQGKKVKEENGITIPAGNQRLVIKTPDLGRGIYLVAFGDADIRLTQKVATLK